MSAARFEIVRTDAEQPWHARFRAVNGRIVWTTEQYARRRAAYGAIEALCIGLVSKGVNDMYVVEVRHVDERSGS